MNPVRLRSWIRRYGNVGVFLVGGYLGWRHLWTQRRTALISALVLVTGSAGFLVWAHYQKSHPRKITALVVPVVSPTHLNENLRAAVRHNNLGAVSAALRAGANVNAADSDGNTVLMLAAQKASENVVRLLLQHGANVNVERQHGATAALDAVKRKHIEILRLLLYKGADMRDPELLAQAAGDGSNTIVRLLLAHGAKVNAQYHAEYNEIPRIALLEALEHHHRDTLALLVAHGADINFQQLEDSALSFAIDENDLPLVEFLVAHRAKVNVRWFRTTLIEHAIEHPAILKFLLHHGAKVDFSARWDTTPLMIAADCGNITSVKLLLAHGANVNYVSEYNGRTPLMKAIQSCHLEIVKTLLRHGADVNLQTDSGDCYAAAAFCRQSALKFAEQTEHQDIIRLLKRAGARE